MTRPAARRRARRASTKVGERRSGEREEFGELLRFTLAGWVGGLAVGWGLDAAGAQRSGIGSWLVRTLAGEGESLFEGLWALRRRLAGVHASLAEAYGWGKVAGMAIPWVVDGVSRAIGIDMIGPASFYIPLTGLHRYAQIPSPATGSGSRSATPSVDCQNCDRTGSNGSRSQILLPPGLLPY